MIERRNFKKLEYHLFNYHEILNEINDLRNDIIEASPKPPDGMPKGNNISDPTGSKAINLERVEGDIKWLTAIEELVEVYKKTNKHNLLNLIRLHYFEKKNRIEVLRGLCCERSTFYEWRKKIVTDLALKAACKGLVKF